MRKVVYSLIGLMLFATTGMAVGLTDVKQGDVKVTLSVPQIVSLVIVTPAVVVVPGPEDYNRKLFIPGPHESAPPVEDGHITLHGCLTGAPITTAFRGKGFVDRAEAIRIIIFSNAQNGATVYVHGNQPAGPTGILRLEDTFLTVMTEKTWVLLNRQEGAHTAGPGCTSSTPALCDPATCKHYQTIPVTGYARFLQMTNEAQRIFAVTMATKAPRDVTFKLGIGNLDRYTEGEYSNTLVFTLMPNV